MKILVDSGVVSARKDGRWMFYSISATGCGTAASLLRELTAVAIDKDDRSNEICCGPLYNISKNEEDE